MMYSEDQLRQHTYEVQSMLRDINRIDPDFPPIRPDGIFDSHTQTCISLYQERCGLESTGVVDSGTWELLFQESTDIRRQTAPPAGILPFGNCQPSLEPDDIRDAIGMIQIMLWTLSRKFNNITPVPVTMVYDQPTIDQLHEIQSISGIPQNDVLDAQTWNALVILYNEYCCFV